MNPSAATGDASGWIAVNAGAHSAGVSDGDGYGWWIFNGSLSQTLMEGFIPGTYALAADVIDRPGEDTGWDFGLYYDDGGVLSGAQCSLHPEAKGQTRNANVAGCISRRPCRS